MKEYGEEEGILDRFEGSSPKGISIYIGGE
jgi:hypothetical protein